MTGGAYYELNGHSKKRTHSQGMLRQRRLTCSLCCCSIAAVKPLHRKRLGAFEGTLGCKLSRSRGCIIMNKVWCNNICESTACKEGGVLTLSSCESSAEQDSRWPLSILLWLSEPLASKELTSTQEIPCWQELTRRHLG